MLKFNITTIIFSFWLSLSATTPPPVPIEPLPSEAQLKWHELEFYGMITYSMSTYLGQEWAFGDQPATLFNPSNFSADQIVETLKKAGMKGVLLVAKHHDGFCLWPTKTTAYSVKNSLWKNGKGDMVKEFETATRRNDMSFGLYCSPWDRNFAGYAQDSYITAYHAQLRELFTQYGPLFIAWFDGANGGDGYYGGTRDKRKIDAETYYQWDKIWKMLRELQPGAVNFGNVFTDIRWVGNEAGFAGVPCWHTYTPRGKINPDAPSASDYDYKGATQGTVNGKYWSPAECDVPLRKRWFWIPNDKPRTDEQLKNIYFASVGRGCALDIGVAPDKTGRLGQDDVDALTRFGAWQHKMYSRNLADGGILTASNIRGKDTATYGPQFLTDTDRYSYWATDDGMIHEEVTLTLPEARRFSVVRLRENIKLGQRIRSWQVYVQVNGEWELFGKGESIGASCLIRGKPVTATAVKVKILDAVKSICLSDLALFLEPETLAAPIITRNKTGSVTLNAEDGTLIYYTLDGSEPHQKSTRYTAPFVCREGVVRAISFKDNAQSESVRADFPMTTEKWKVISPAGAEPAVDGDPKTAWTVNQPPPCAITIDMGETLPLTGFIFTPQKTNDTIGLPDRYRFRVSSDGQNWETAAEGEFSNISANPLPTTITFKTQKEAKFFRFEVLRVIRGNQIVIPEINVITQ